MCRCQGGSPIKTPEAFLLPHSLPIVHQTPTRYRQHIMLVIEPRSCSPLSMVLNAGIGEAALVKRFGL